MPLSIDAHLVRISGRAMYLFPISISDLLKVVEIPDPNYPFPGNRRVNKKHAAEFGDYWELKQGDWIVPPILLDSAVEIEVSDQKKKHEQAGRNSVVIQLDGSEPLHILDGQHRVFGWHLKLREIDARLDAATTAYNKAILSNSDTAMKVAVSEIERLNELNRRFEVEQVSIQLVDQIDEVTHKQFFVDIAKNALGINKTVQSKFDMRSIVNRVGSDLIESHGLLKGRVDLEKTSCSGTSQNLLSVVNLSDIVRHCCFGVGAKVTAKREALYKDDQLFEVVATFLDAVVKNSDALKKVKASTLKVADLRRESLLASSTVWRGLAGGFYEACVVPDDELGTLEVDKRMLRQFEQMMSELSDLMSLPISRSWMNTKLFMDRSSKAPLSRTQDLKALASLIAEWTHTEKPFDPPNAGKL